jgi:hypothetical protein
MPIKLRPALLLSQPFLVFGFLHQKHRVSSRIWYRRLTSLHEVGDQRLADVCGLGAGTVQYCTMAAGLPRDRTPPLICRASEDASD